MNNQVIKNEKGYRIEKRTGYEKNPQYAVINNDDRNEEINFGKDDDGQFVVSWYGSRATKSAFNRFYTMMEMTEQFIRDEDLA